MGAIFSFCLLSTVYLIIMKLTMYSYNNLQNYGFVKNLQITQITLDIG